MGWRSGLSLHGAALAHARRDRQFRQALVNPTAWQWRRLRQLTQGNQDTAFGRQHHFAAIDSPRAWRAAVPPRDHDGLAEWLEPVAAGAPNVLTHDPVTRLVPTGGSSGGRKLIPWTAGLAQEFLQALGPWLHDLGRRYPGTRQGPAYWSLSPAVADQTGPVPIGFDDDSAYLGRWGGWLVRPTLVAPDAITQVYDLDAFRYATALHLLAAADLRLISVWHPSYLTVICEVIDQHWPQLMADLAEGMIRPPGGNIPPHLLEALRLPPAPERAALLEPGAMHGWWPQLQLISCWTDGPAHRPASLLQDRFPGIALQGKGLLATEGVISIPYAGRRPLAVTSHVIEFLDEAGRCHWPHEVRVGASYEILLTTAGGLYRYRLGDLVAITGFIGATPCLQFIRRTSDISDLVGEKVHADQVDAILARILPDHCGDAGLCAVSGDAPHYRLWTSRAPPSDAALGHIDLALRDNPHYAWARDLGQLGPVVHGPPPRSNEHQGLGNRKPRSLVTLHCHD